MKNDDDLGSGDGDGTRVVESDVSRYADDDVTIPPQTRIQQR
ncbi:hypothetical protein AB0M45_27995 [Nocardia sp. NPDC051787]